MGEVLLDGEAMDRATPSRNCARLIATRSDHQALTTRQIERRSSWSKYASMKAIERISALSDLARKRL